MDRTISGVLLAMLLAGIVYLPFNIMPVRANGTIHIRADGSIDPPTANITTVDNVTYTFNDNIFDLIVVERDDIVIDGAGYTLQGTGVVDSRGIDLSGRTNVAVKNTHIKNFWHGIELYSSSSNNISENSMENNYDGIALTFSSNNLVSGNKMTANDDYGIWLWESFNSSIIENNVAANHAGIALDSSSNNVISRNNATNNSWAGIVLESSSNNILSENNITANDEDGIELFEDSTYNSIYDNEIASNIETGIELRSGRSNSIFNNTVSENGLNIWVIGSSNNNIVNNEVAKGGWGISFTDSFNNTLQTNSIDENNYNLAVSGVFIQHYIQHIDFSNLVNGKAVYYLVDEKNLVIDSSTFPEVGYIGIVNCENMSVKDLSLEENAEGIILANTNNSLIENLRINGVSVGIEAQFGSSNNTIRNNTVFWSEMAGVYLNNLCCNNSIYQNNVTCLNSGIRTLSSSNYNSIYHNTFIQYYPQQISTSSINVWDDGFEGNFWSDYTGQDLNSDGIGDTPYVIDADNQDRYPLMSPYGSAPPTALVGDVNLDGKVNILDLVKILFAYHSDPTSPTWNPNCDLNGDNFINIQDIAIAASHFGETID